MTTQRACWKRGQGPCFGKVQRHQPFGSSGTFDYCQAHINADKQVAERAGTPGWCFCGNAVINQEALAYRRGLNLGANPNGCVQHQPRPKPSPEELERRHRDESARDDVATRRDFETDTGYVPGGRL